MVVLNAEVQDPEPVVGRGRDRITDGRKNAIGSEATDRDVCPERDVHGMRRRVRRSVPVRDAGAAVAGRLAAGATATTAPGGAGRKRKLRSPCQFDRATIAR